MDGRLSRMGGALGRGARRLGRVLVARRARVLVRAVVLAVGIFAAMPLIQLRVAETQTQGDMEGWHPIGIENETQRKLFFSLICQCGCPRETLGTCACNFADARRREAKAALAAGMTVEQIQQEYAKRWGPQALAVPPNSGKGWVLWALPLTAIAAGMLGVILLVRRWRMRAPLEATPIGGGSAPAEKDEYDDKLDRELKELDRE